MVKLDKADVFKYTMAGCTQSLAIMLKKLKQPPYKNIPPTYLSHLTRTQLIQIQTRSTTKKSIIYRGRG